MGEAFWSFYAICCDPSTDSVSLERKARLNVFLENTCTHSNHDIAALSKTLQLILQGKVSKDEIPTLEEMEKWLKAKSLIDAYSLESYLIEAKLYKFYRIADTFKPRQEFTYKLPFQKPSKQTIAVTPSSGYQPLPHQAVAAAQPVIGRGKRDSLFTQTSKKLSVPHEFISERFITDKSERNALQALQVSAQQYVGELAKSNEWAIEDGRLEELEAILIKKIETDRSSLCQKTGLAQSCQCVSNPLCFSLGAHLKAARGAKRENKLAPSAAFVRAGQCSRL